MLDFFHQSFLYLRFFPTLYEYACSPLLLPLVAEFLSLCVFSCSYNSVGWLLETSLLFSRKWHSSLSLCVLLCLLWFSEHMLYSGSISLLLHSWAFTRSQLQSGKKCRVSTWWGFGSTHGWVWVSLDEVFPTALGRLPAGVLISQQELHPINALWYSTMPLPCSPHYPQPWRSCLSTLGAAGEKWVSQNPTQLEYLGPYSLLSFFLWERSLLASSVLFCVALEEEQCWQSLSNLL